MWSHLVDGSLPAILRGTGERPLCGPLWPPAAAPASRLICGCFAASFGHRTTRSPGRAGKVGATIAVAVARLRFEAVAIEHQDVEIASILRAELFPEDRLRDCERCDALVLVLRGDGASRGGFHLCALPYAASLSGTTASGVS
jgi:hypothetical protein